MRQRTRQRTPYQSLLLEHIEQILDMKTVANDKYIISCLDETGSITIEKFCSQKDLVPLRASVKDVSAAISSSLWLGEYFTPHPIPKLKLPFDVSQKSLIIYDLPSTAYHKAINNYAKKVMSSSTEYTIKRHKEGLQVNFSRKEDLFAFWRSLDYCLVNGTAIKAMILLKKTPLQYAHMVRSQSVVFSKPRRNTRQNQRQEKQPKIIQIQDNNFPTLK